MDSQQRWSFRRFETLFHEPHGASTAEYAMLLVLILVVGMAGFFGLSSFTRWAFRQNSQLAFAEQSEPSVSSPETMEHASHRLIAKAIAIIAKTEAAIQFAAGIVGLLLGTSLVLACWQILHSRRSPREVEPPLTANRRPQTPRRELLYSKRAVLRRVLKRAIDTGQAAELPVAKLMSEHLVAVPPRTAIHRVVQTIKEKGVSHVLVIEHDGHLVGIISHRDLSRRTGRYAEDIMTREPLTVDISASANQAVSLMLEQNISCLPVMKDHRVRGVFTKTDVMIGFQALIQALELVLTSQDEEDTPDGSLESDESSQEKLLT
jgi:CBS domain-containing protein/Flp pilus assembly pilin Flp